MARETKEIILFIESIADTNSYSIWISQPFNFPHSKKYPPNFFCKKRGDILNFNIFLDKKFLITQQSFGLDIGHSI